MYQYTIPSPISEKDLTKLTQKFAGREQCQTTLLWVPYQTLECTIQTLEGKTENTKTTLNIMFPDKIFDKKDIILLFRPNLLKVKRRKYKQINLRDLTRAIPERIADICEINYDRIAEKIISLSKNVYENIEKLKPLLVNHQSINTILRSIFPSTDVLGRLLFSEERKAKKFLEKELAKTMALSTIIKMTLNINNLPEKIDFQEKEIFYHPYLIISTKNTFIFVDLVKRGMLSKRFTEDPILNRLVKENKRANEIVRRALNQEEFNTYV